MTQTLSAACLRAFIESGTLMNGDVPAGLDLLKQDTITIGYVAIDENTDLLDTDSLVLNHASEDLIKYLAHKNQLELFFKQIYTIPDDMNQYVKEALGFWYEGNIEFVPLSDNPDIQIFSYLGAISDPLGFGNLPKNTTHPEFFYGGEDYILGIDIHHSEDPYYC